MTKLKFWGKQYLDNLTIIVGVAVLMLVFLAVGEIELSSGMDNLFLEGIALFPYYLCFSASFAILLIGVGTFQTYFPVLVSMNVTRKSVVNGIMLCILAIMFTVLAVAALVWKFVPLKGMELNVQVLLLFGGVQLIFASLSLVCGYVVARWKKVGTIVMGAVGLIVGGSVGASVSIFGNMGFLHVIMDLIEKFQFTWVFVLGLVLYLMVGIFIRVSTKKLEIRI